MSDTEVREKSQTKVSNINVNTILNAIVLGTMAWVGNTLKENVMELSKVREKIAVIEAVSAQKGEQLNRIENRQNTQQDQINSIQLELTKIRKQNP